MRARDGERWREREMESGRESEREGERGGERVIEGERGRHRVAGGAASAAGSPDLRGYLEAAMELSCAGADQL